MRHCPHHSHAQETPQKDVDDDLFSIRSFQGMWLLRVRSGKLGWFGALVCFSGALNTFLEAMRLVRGLSKLGGSVGECQAMSSRPPLPW